MKKVFFISLITIMSLSLISCGESKKNVKKIQDKPKVEEKVSRVNDKHIDILESDKAYEEMSTDERIVASEIMDDYWNDLSEEDKTKYKDRREFLKKSKEEAKSKWKKETEDKNKTSEKAVPSTPQEVSNVNKDDLKLKVENSIPNNAKGKSYTVDILTPTKEQGYIVSIQVANKDFVSEDSCKTFTKDLLAKLKGTDGICSLDITFVSNMKATNFLRIENGNKIKNGYTDAIEIQKF